MCYFIKEIVKGQKEAEKGIIVKHNPAKLIISAILFALPLFAMQPEQLPKSEVEKAIAAARTERQQAALQHVAPRSFLAQLPVELLDQLQEVATEEMRFYRILDQKEGLGQMIRDYLKDREFLNLSEQEKLDLLEVIFANTRSNAYRFMLNEVLALPSFQLIVGNKEMIKEFIEGTGWPEQIAAELTNSSGALAWLTSYIDNNPTHIQKALRTFIEELGLRAESFRIIPLNNVSILERYLQAGLPVNQLVNVYEGALSYNAPLLTIAIRRNPDPNILQLLLKYGADINLPDSDGRTALQNARELHVDPEIIDLLIAHGAKEPEVTQ